MSSSNITLDSIKDFLEEKVASNLKLLKANDNNVNAYELVNPQVHIGWIPPKGYLPEGMEYMAPCLVVGYDEDNDDGQDLDLNIRISVVVYKPGTYKPNENSQIEYIPNMEGYRDLLNLMDLTKAELKRTRIINQKVTIQMPIKSGMYQNEQPYPYWYGWITFSARTIPGLYVPSIAQQYL